MKFTDILELAKQGYKPTDIKELLALAPEKDTEDKEPEITANNSSETETGSEQTPAGTDNSTVGDEQNGTADLQAEINKLKKQLEQAQKANTTQTVQTEKPKSATDILAGFMEDKNGYTEKEKR